VRDTDTQTDSDRRTADDGELMAFNLCHVDVYIDTITQSYISHHSTTSTSISSRQSTSARPMYVQLLAAE